MTASHENGLTPCQAFRSDHTSSRHPRRDRARRLNESEIGVPFRLAVGLTLCVTLTAISPSLGNDDSTPFQISDRIPFGQPPISYHSTPTDTVVDRLRSALESMRLSLPYHPRRGYLDGLLNELKIPVESQLLVFSKTALNQDLVGPKTPRAIYFRDDVYVAWVPGAATIEISALDATSGAVFYTINQDPDQQPVPVRETRCLACHAGATTRQVPGSMVRSFLPDPQGTPVAGFSRVTHAMDISKRWGGWYVTGDRDSTTHRGGRYISSNEAVADPQTWKRIETDRTIDFDLYPATTSDVVGHLVFNHQVHGQNLITRVNYEHRYGRRSDAEERLIRYLLFADEAPLPVSLCDPDRPSRFAEWFTGQAAGRSHDGRSLRQLNLTSRLFEYRLSDLVTSALFRNLPDRPRQRIAGRVLDVLDGAEVLSGSAPIPADERRAIRGILQATAPEFIAAGRRAK